MGVEELKRDLCKTEREREEGGWGREGNSPNEVAPWPWYCGFGSKVALRVMIIPCIKMLLTFYFGIVDTFCSLDLESNWWLLLLYLFIYLFSPIYFFATCFDTFHINGTFYGVPSTITQLPQDEQYMQHTIERHMVGELWGQASY